MAEGFVPDDDAPLFVISVAAQLAGMHAQTLRQYDRLGLVTPQRTRGGGRRYSARDIARLREVQRLSQEEGVSLPGIQRILDLQDRLAELERDVHRLSAELDRARQQTYGQRVFAAGAGGDVVAVRAGQRPASARPGRALTLWRPVGR